LRAVPRPSIEAEAGADFLFSLSSSLQSLKPDFSEKFFAITSVDPVKL